ncbi:hypothetical protein [Actinoplanes sp. NPDC020271]|uniref:hypothetical protein n=1 Tax=Actinoplanes sp. NPDC020271 TaxID=3363896 RepID=UPI0037AF084B
MTRLAAVSGGILAALAMAAGPAQAAPKDDPDVRAACDAFNRIGAQTGLWTHQNCANWRVNRDSSVLIVNNGRVRAGTWTHGVWPFDFGNLPQVINVNGVNGPRTIPVKPPKK